MAAQTARDEIVSTAEAMLRGDVHLIEGCRRIWHLSHEMGDSDNPVFLPIRGIESETDQFPLGDVRNQYAPDYLKRMDEELERYLAQARKDILSSCREIIHAFS
jgi:hypothetical protein